MEAHIWPSLYPAIIVGLFVSLSTGAFSVIKMVVGGLGGLIGGAVAYFALAHVGAWHGAVGSISTMLAGALVAFVAVRLRDACSLRRRSAEKQGE